MFRQRVAAKTPAEIATMRRAGLVVADIHAALREAVRPGVTTGDLDEVARGVLERAGSTSNFLGYQGFPAVICASVNEEVVHGIPGDRVIGEGDLVSLDCGAIVDGWHGDAAITVRVGRVRDEIARLDDVTREAMWRGIAAATVGGRIGDISYAIQSYVRAAGDYGIVEGFTGHGIGREMHEDPDVPNVGRRRRGPRIEAGSVLAIEPMITLGDPYTVTKSDDWTEATADGSWGAHWEHTVAILPEGLWVLTAPDGGRAELEARGIACAAR